MLILLEPKADAVHISEKTISNKMHGHSDFTISESDIIHRRYFPLVSKGKLFKSNDVTEVSA